MAKAVIFWADQSLQERLGIAQETSQEADERFPLRVPRLARDQVPGAVSIQIRQGRRVLLVEPGGETARGEVLEEGPVQELERRLRVVRTTGEQDTGAAKVLNQVESAGERGVEGAHSIDGAGDVLLVPVDATGVPPPEPRSEARGEAQEKGPLVAPLPGARGPASHSFR